MRLRRCAIVHLEPRERLVFDLALLGDGGNGLRNIIEWIALAPHLDDEVTLSADAAQTLGAMSSGEWRELDELRAAHPPAAVDALRAAGLLVAENSAEAARDERVRATHWRGTSAVMHYASRWRGIDTKDAEQRFTELSEGSSRGDHLA